LRLASPSNEKLTAIVDKLMSKNHKPSKESVTVTSVAVQIDIEALEK
jgi:hypothetical protein